MDPRLMKSLLSHLDQKGAARMVDIGLKAVTCRDAMAYGDVLLPPECRKLLRSGGQSKKGPVLQVARLAGIMAAKRTAELIPLCHQVQLDSIEITFRQRKSHLIITSQVRSIGRTGVEMEALVAVSVAALTVYDMLKSISHDLVIGQVQLVLKRGGKSGTIRRAVTQ